MRPISPIRLMVIGSALLLIGVILPFLMVLRLLEPSFPLGFISYASSLAGLVLGLLGLVQYIRPRGEGP
jgi:hypothetical protein